MNSHNVITKNTRISGIVILVTITLLSFNFYACQNLEVEKEEIISQNDARDNFLENLNLTTENLSGIKVYSSEELAENKSSHNTTNLHEIKFSKNAEIDHNTISNYGDLIYSMSIGEIRLNSLDISKNDINYKEDNDIISLYVDESSIENSLIPLSEAAEAYLYSLDFSKNEIEDMMESNGAKKVDLIPLVALIIQSENTNYGSNNSFSSDKINHGKSIEEMNLELITSCAASAIGLDIMYSLASELGKNNDKWKKKAIKKLIGKIASRALGPIGVAIAVSSFALCVGGLY